MKRKYSYSVVLTILLLGANTLSAKQVDLGEFFSKNDVLPEVTSDNFIDKKFKSCFKWLTKAKNSAHFPAYSNSPSVSFLGQKVWEVNVRFSDKKFKDAEISFYNRGDAGQINEKEFLAMLSGIDKKISEWIPEKPKELPKKRLPKNVGYIESKVWIKGKLQVTLIWSASKVRRSRDDKPEYIKLTVAEFDKKKDPRKTYLPKSSASMKKKNHKDNVVKEKNGDVFIDGIPMVDQGVDQHVIAQMAASSADKGTNADSMLAMVKKAGVKFRVKVKVYEESKHSGKVTREMQKFNKFLKRKKKPLISIPPSSPDFFESIYSQLQNNIDSFREYKCVKCKMDYSRFKKNIITSSDLGIPIVWGVQLGLIKEEKRLSQTGGGHLRLIIGYNNKTDEIVFSDTWGAEHEFKKIARKDAWTITTSYAALIPR